MCKICRQNKIETLEHFILDCPELQCIRRRILFLQLPRKENTGDLLKKALLFLEDEVHNEMIIDTVFQIWLERKKRLEN